LLNARWWLMWACRAWASVGICMYACVCVCVCVWVCVLHTLVAEGLMPTSSLTLHTLDSGMSCLSLCRYLKIDTWALKLLVHEALSYY
jgi:hypothetical protein